MPTTYPEGWLRTAIETAASCNAFPLRVPAGQAPPFVMFGQAGQQDLDTLDETAGLTTIVEGTFAVEIYADGYLQAKQLAAAIRAALRNFAGSVGDLKIHRVGIDGQQDGDPVFLDGRDEPTYVVEQTYSIAWEE